MRRTAVLACAVGLTLAAAPAASAHLTGEVADPTTTRVVGGEQVDLAMHGDRIPPGSDFDLRGRVRTMPRIAAAALPTSWCGTERSTDDTANASQVGARVKVVYAHAQDEPDRFDAYRDLIQADIGTLANWVASSAGGTRTIRFDTGTSCGADYVDIASIQLPRTRAAYVGSASRASLLISDVRNAMAGMTGTRNYLVYADDLYADDNVLGTGQMPIDDTHGGRNASNSGGASAMVWGDGGADFVPERLTTILHEVSHTLGAVQDSAPHSTQAGHCYEDYDVMCYDDGGPYFNSGSVVNRCAPSSPVLPYECGGDDYFNPSPAAGSYLATHWNLYDSAFMCPVVSCVMPKSAPTPGPDPGPGTTPDPGSGSQNPPPTPDPGQAVGADASAWLDQFMAGGSGALRKLGLRGIAQGRTLSLAGQPPAGYSVQVDLMVGASAIAGGALDTSGRAQLKVPRVHRLLLARRTKVRFTLQGVIRGTAGGGPPTVKRVSVTLKAPAKKKRTRR
ncbi:MAG: hypothetical protein QOE06_55 [Thermoleophilaceae bacterium]|nr:hypothetical protein [Thermoleophilaceae bacterium]